jgi:hypothetical protein
MLPNKIRPKYKTLTKLTLDIGVLLYNKKFNKKKWKFFKEFNKQNTSKVITYHTRYLPDQPVYSRFFYKTSIIERLQIKYLYKQALSYKLRLIAKKNKNKSWFGYIKFLEQNSISFLYRLKLVNSYNEALLHQGNKHILISGNPIKTRIKIGDILHFSIIFKKIIRKRIIINYSVYNEHLLEPLTKEIKKEREEQEKRGEAPKGNNKKYYFGIHTCIDFEPNTFCFCFIHEIKYFKNHPFRIPFESIYQWYSYRI